MVREMKEEGCERQAGVSKADLRLSCSLQFELELACLCPSIFVSV